MSTVVLETIDPVQWARIVALAPWPNETRVSDRTGVAWVKTRGTGAAGGDWVPVDDLVSPDPSGGVSQAYVDAKVSDASYDQALWNGILDVAPSKNAVRDALVAMGLAAAPVLTVITTGNITPPNPTGAGVFADFDTAGNANARPTDIVIPNAVTGQWVRVDGAFRITDTGAFAMLFDIFTINNGVRINRFGTSTSGIPTWVVASGVARDIASGYSYQIQAGDIENGSVRLRFVHLVQGVRTVAASAGVPFRLEGRGPFG